LAELLDSEFRKKRVPQFTIRKEGWPALPKQPE